MSIRRLLHRPLAALARRREQGFGPGWIVVLIGALLVAVWLLTAHLIGAERASADRDARNSARDLSSIYGALMVRALDQIDLSLGMLRFACERQEPREALRQLQEEVLVPSSMLFSLEVADENGLVVASNHPVVDDDVADAAHFRFFKSQQQDPSDRLYAAVERRPGGRMVFARRITRADGRFAGIVSVSMDQGYFTSWYDRTRLGEHGVLGFADAQGQLIVTRSADVLVPSDPARRDDARRIPVDLSSSNVVRHPWDGERRYTVTEPLPRFPFVTLVGLSVDDRMAAFEARRYERLLLAALLSAVLCALGGLLWLMARSQARTRRAQATYHAASQASADAQVVLHEVTDALGKVSDFLVTDVNPSAAALVGRPVAELIGRRLSGLVPDWRRTGMHEAFVAATRNGTPAEHEWENHDPRLHAQWLNAQLVPATGGIVVVLRDVSARKRAEQDLVRHNAELTALNEELSALNRELTQAQEQLVQSEKLASIGLLAAGVAHEINNPVGFVMSNVSTLGRYVDSLFALLDRYRKAEADVADAALREDLRRLRDEVELDYLQEDIPTLMNETRDGLARVRKIVQDLRDFSRVDSHKDWQPADLHQGIDSTLNVVNNEIKYKADVVKEYGDLPPVECLPSEINQVVMNLLVNAGHAIPAEQRGRITIRTGACEGEAWFEVEDTGCGISEENLARIFDPFFTTKPVGKGTGLGLSLSYGIVRKHGGRIEVRSEPGQGTCFRVTLPLRQGAQGQGSQDGARPGSDAHAGVAGEMPDAALAGSH